MRRRFPIVGMMCAVCAGTVEKTLRETEGVVRADVNLADATATVEWNEALTSPDIMYEKLLAVGYEMIVVSDERKAMERQEAEEEAQTKRILHRLAVAWTIAIPLTLGCILHLHAFWFILLSMFGAALVLFYSAGEFYIRGWKAVRNGRASMDTLVALSTCVSFLFSLFASVFPKFFEVGDMTVSLFYDASAMIPAFVLTGKYMESKARRRTGSALRGLMSLQPSETILVEADGSSRKVNVHDIVAGDVILVRPGERIAADGEVVKGESGVDESMLTGESIPEWKHEGSKVKAGTLNGSGSMEVRVTHSADDSMLADIIRRVRDAQGSKAPVQRLVDKVSSVFVPIVVLISLTTFATWILLGEPMALAVTTAVSVLVIACPCAMGLATPTALTAGIGRGADYHILVKDFSALEKLAKINVAVFDKTGTLTENRPEVTHVYPTDLPEETCSAIYALESKSEHPLARGIAERFNEYAGAGDIDEFKSMAGNGVEGRIAGKLWWVGSERMAKERVGEIRIPEEMEGSTLVIAGCEDSVEAVMSIEDKLIPGVEKDIEDLKRKGIRTVMLTGDRDGVSQKIGRQAGVDEIESEMLPSDKEQYIRGLMQLGLRPAMVGDGINDAGALASAYVSVAMSTGSDIAMDVAEVTFAGHNIGLLNKAVVLSAKTLRIIRQNLGWALVYNILALPVAAGVLYPSLGLLLSPIVCSGAMAVSSVCVVLNSLRLKNIKL